MSLADSQPNRRILVVDDNTSIHDDFRKILSPPADTNASVRASASGFLGRAAQPAPAKANSFELAYACQGQEALDLVSAAKAAGRPFAMAFVDVRMPPGWDGIETTGYLWEVDPALQIVICTAYSDYSWEDMSARLQTSDRLVILKKPFDMTEVMQLAHALTTKWQLALQAQWRLEDLDRMVQERTAELQLAHQNLQEHERKLSTLMGNLPGMAYRCCHDEQRTMEFLSDGCLSLTGYAPADLTQNATLAYGSLIAAEDRASVQSQIKAALKARGRYQVVYRIRAANGTEKWIWEQGVGVYQASGELLALEGFICDITERRQLEQQLRQAHKLEAVGQLAGGVAHHFNNLLSIVLGQAELGAADLANTGRIDPTCFPEIMNAGNRAAGLVRQLLAFSRRQMMRLESLDLNQLVRALPARLAADPGAAIRVECALAPNLPLIEADGAMVQQALANLVLNARDAMPPDGCVSITTELVHFESAFAGNNGETPAGDFVCISVVDTGRGIAPERLPFIFEPFFTTKEVGQGTGLGLAMAYGIAKQHGGWISAASQLGHGSTFKLFLPLVAETPVKPGDIKPQELLAQPWVFRRRTEETRSC